MTDFPAVSAVDHTLHTAEVIYTKTIETEREELVMKKYVKPELFFERYELSQHVANCVLELGPTDSYTCSVESVDAGYGMEMFMDAFISGENCVVDGEALCYQNGTMGDNRIVLMS